MTYQELKKIFIAHEANKPSEHLTAIITFTEGSFREPYSKTERTYVISSDNKAFCPNMSGYSVIGNCLDGNDMGVRLETYMKEEKGGPMGWEVEDCSIQEYVLSCTVDRDIQAPQFFLTEKEAENTMLLQFLRVMDKADAAIYTSASEKELLGVSGLRKMIAEADREGKDLTLTEAGCSLRPAHAYINATADRNNWNWRITPVHVANPVELR